MAKAAYHNPQNNLHSSAQHATAEDRIHYERHQSEDEDFFAQVEAEIGSSLPDFVKDESDAFLECGVLAYGFLRLRCVDCIHEKLVAFSCKR